MVSVTCSDVCRLLGLLFLLVPCFWLFNISLAQTLATGDAAVQIFERNGNTHLPSEVRGVLWMAGNTYPELLTTLEAGSYDLASRVITQVMGTRYAWFFNTDSAGWLELIFVQLSWTLFGLSEIRVEWDKDFRLARLPLVVFGSYEVKVWYLERQDDKGHIFIRGQFDASGNKQPIYTIKKVIAYDGTKLAAFEEMVASTRDAVPVEDIENIIYMNQTILPRAPSASLPKTYLQLVVGDPGALSAFVGIALLIFYAATCGFCIKRSNAYGALGTSARTEPTELQALAGSDA